MRIITCSYGMAKDGGHAENGDTLLKGKHEPSSKSSNALQSVL